MITRTRAVFAVAAFLVAPPSVVILARHDRWDGALTLAVLFHLYVGAEVVAELRRQSLARRRARELQRAQARVLAGVTESREGWWAS